MGILYVRFFWGKLALVELKVSSYARLRLTLRRTRARHRSRGSGSGRGDPANLQHPSSTRAIFLNSPALYQVASRDECAFPMRVSMRVSR